MPTAISPRRRAAFRLFAAALLVSLLAGCAPKPDNDTPQSTPNPEKMKTFREQRMKSQRQ